jgi:nicotinamidase/pyrazinamidase
MSAPSPALWKAQVTSSERGTELGVALADGDALIVVDLQRDFLPGGRLPVPAGGEVIAPLNRYLARFRARGLPIYATRDWHPPKHCSFAPQGGPWPPHCVAGSEGAAFATELALPSAATVVSKATQPDQEAYSGFDGTDLAARLRGRNVQRLFIGGLATEYCVVATVKDAIAHGFEVFLLEDAIRPVDLEPGEGAKALAEMQRLGAKPVSLAALAG